MNSGKIDVARLPKIILVGGAPGAGKSTLAKRILECFPEGSAVHLENDQYVDYTTPWNFEKTNCAMDDCLISTHLALAEGKTVIVSNTFATLKYVKTYYYRAQRFSTKIAFIRILNPVYDNIHGVLKEIVEDMDTRISSPELQGAVRALTPYVLTLQSSDLPSDQEEVSKLLHSLYI